MMNRKPDLHDVITLLENCRQRTSTLLGLTAAPRANRHCGDDLSRRRLRVGICGSQRSGICILPIRQRSCDDSTRCTRLRCCLRASHICDRPALRLKNKTCLDNRAQAHNSSCSGIPEADLCTGSDSSLLGRGLTEFQSAPFTSSSVAPLGPPTAVG